MGTMVPVSRSIQTQFAAVPTSANTRFTLLRPSINNVCALCQTAKLGILRYVGSWPKIIERVVTYPSRSPPDGGGIRGLIQLIILDNIMETIKSRYTLETTPSPYQYFDLIGGTSTGGYARPFLCSALHVILSQIDRAPSRKTSHVD